MIENLKKWFGSRLNKKPIQEPEVSVEDLDVVQKQLQIEMFALMNEWKILQEKLEIDSQTTLNHDEQLELGKILFESNKQENRNDNLKFAFFLINQAESLIKAEIEVSITEGIQKNKSLINQIKVLQARNKVLGAHERLYKIFNDPAKRKAIELLEKMAKETSEKEERLKAKNNERK
ncbi:MAG: hypothetical protein ACI85I_000213 [Arenicella sp.]|jgi:hypothetical protein